jgi:hypothetical protein
MDHPFFEVSGLNEEELRDKLAQLQTRLFSAYAIGMSYDLRFQIESMIETIEMEIQARYAAQMQEAWDKMFPDVIETEPSLVPGKETVDSKVKIPGKKKEGVERPANMPSFNKVYKK